MNVRCLAGAAALTLALSGCSTPAPSAGSQPAPPLNEPPIAEWMETQPVPDFLEEEQQELFLHAFAAANFLMGCDTNQVDEYPDESGALPEQNQHETVELDGTSYVVAQGRYRRRDDFKAMMDSLFTPEYQQELLGNSADGVYFPVFTSTEDGRLCYLDAARGSDLEYGWCDTPDSYELISQTEEEIVFDLIGHYAQLGYDPQADMPVVEGEYTEAYPIRMVNTADGWRFSEFHLPY